MYSTNAAHHGVCAAVVQEAKNLLALPSASLHPINCDANSTTSSPIEFPKYSFIICLSSFALIIIVHVLLDFGIFFGYFSF